MFKIEENILNFKKAMELLAKGYVLVFNDEMWLLRYGFIKLNCFGHIVDKEEEDYNGSFFNDWDIFKGGEPIC